jgi:hypothetical protein
MIKKWKKFKESISGTTDMRSFGPGYEKPKLHNTLSTNDTELLSGYNGKIYSLGEFRELYNQYLKLPNSNKEDLSDFNENNLNKLIEILE